jgi:predicted  nucleic acid-binding Zn-ribbon protein
MNFKNVDFTKDTEGTMNMALTMEFQNDLQTLEKEIEKAQNAVLAAEMRVRKLQLQRQALVKILESLA